MALEWSEQDQKYIENPNLGILVEVDVSRMSPSILSHAPSAPRPPAASACAPHVEVIGFSYFGSRPEFMFTILTEFLQQLKEKEKMAEDHQKVRCRPHHRQISLTIVSACKQVQA